MLGVRDFCPTLRKTDKLQVFISKNLSDEAKIFYINSTE
jgi:hypothetical protein